MEGRQFLLRILSWASGVCLGVLAVYFFISPDIEVPVDVVVPVYYLLFGAVIILNELKVKYVLENFKFMQMRTGKALFLILVGGLALRVLSLMNFVVAGVLVANGVITWMWKEGEESQSKYAALR
jgi:hypothetical protein